MALPVPLAMQVEKFVRHVMAHHQLEGKRRDVSDQTKGAHRPSYVTVQALKSSFEQCNNSHLDLNGFLLLLLQLPDVCTLAPVGSDVVVLPSSDLQRGFTEDHTTSLGTGAQRIAGNGVQEVQTPPMDDVFNRFKDVMRSLAAQNHNKPELAMKQQEATDRAIEKIKQGVSESVALQEKCQALHQSTNVDVDKLMAQLSEIRGMIKRRRSLTWTHTGDMPPHMLQQQSMDGVLLGAQYQPIAPSSQGMPLCVPLPSMVPLVGQQLPALSPLAMQRSLSAHNSRSASPRAPFDARPHSPLTAPCTPLAPVLRSRPSPLSVPGTSPTGSDTLAASLAAPYASVAPILPPVVSMEDTNSALLANVRKMYLTGQPGAAHSHDFPKAVMDVANRFSAWGSSGSMGSATDSLESSWPGDHTLGRDQDAPAAPTRKDWDPLFSTLWRHSSGRGSVPPWEPPSPAGLAPTHQLP